ncbi:putative hydroxymethylpyrimidine transporter CytX [Thermococcus sp.]|uniref:putative hydroxymethylpyrimidine transporter CytX n=1 Tax=Thermococcus sp. TaxID=35749 RepID=UPI00076D46BE|nr:putative hydroxymethylpyrimidine transporter CytX [Thermococcus sp.]KUK28912.1 MAG: putative hydroxymethylpyrimidine transporter CytX [Thermococcus sp. 40_45]MBC7094755.1 putative hydroxymethylpyrimidine transporter CytX [Thermococcus sp.]HII66497.1 putative hydroxymethylpyrimidine transporter CytX [Thermococcaceae archaeon]
MHEGYEIKPVEKSKKTFTLITLLAIWFGAGISIAEFWAGALLTPALSLGMAILVIIVGHLLGNAIMGLIALEGEETSLPTMVLSRASLGIKGSILPSILNYLQLIGWTAIMLIVGANAMNAVSKAFGFEGYPLWVLLLGVLVTLWTYIGPKNWEKLEKIAALLLLALSLWLTYVTLKKFPLSDLLTKPGTGEIGAMLALDLVIAMPLSWAPLIADYSRFAKNKNSAFWGTYLGYFISSSLFYFVGALTNMAIGEGDPIEIVAAYGIGIPAMLIITFSTVTTTFLDVYSAAITYKNISPKADAKKQVLFVGALGVILALVFPMEQYESFLLLIGGAFVSLAAIMITDYFLVKKGYNAEALFDENGPFAGYNSKAIIIWSIGFIFYMGLAIEGLFGIHIPLLSELGFRLGSSIPTFILVSVLYYIFGR